LPERRAQKIGWTSATSQQKNYRKYSAPVSGGRQELLKIEVRRRRRPLRAKGQLEVIDDPVHHGIVGNEGGDAHLSLASGTNQGINLVDFYKGLPQSK